MSRALAALNSARAQAPALRSQWALTLHMLEGHAPQFFAAQRLEGELHAALEMLASVPTIALGLDADEAMDRVDARYLRARRGLPVALLEPARAEAFLDDAAARLGSLHAWLMGALLGRPRLYVPQSRLHDLYQLTHQVLLGTDYLARAPPRLEGVLDQLQAAIGELWFPPQPDLLGEVLFCLQRAGRDVRHAVERYAGFQRPDGSFIDAHCTAVGLIVLAHAE